MLSTKLLNKKTNKKLKSVTIIHSATTETVRLPEDNNGVIVHTAVRTKVPLKQKVRGERKKKTTTTTSGAASGDQSAGLLRGSASGKVGKAQPPSSGQTLPFLIGSARLGCDALFGCGEVMLVVGITAQEFLREIRKIVSRIVPGGGWGPPRRLSRHPALRFARANWPSPTWLRILVNRQVTMIDQACADGQIAGAPQSPLSAALYAILHSSTFRLNGRAIHDSQPASSIWPGRDGCHEVCGQSPGLGQDRSQK